MTAKHRWELAAAIGLPLVALTAYLIWVWPRPRGTSIGADLAPYVVCLLLGLPFVWPLARAGRGWLVPVYLLVEFVGLWFYAVMVLCGVRGVCL